MYRTNPKQTSTATPGVSGRRQQLCLGTWPELSWQLIYGLHRCCLGDDWGEGIGRGRHLCQGKGEVRTSFEGSAGRTFRPGEVPGGRLHLAQVLGAQLEVHALRGVVEARRRDLALVHQPPELGVHHLPEYSGGRRLLNS